MTPAPMTFSPFLEPSAAVRWALELTLDSAQPTNGPVPITVEQGDATHYPGEYSQPQSYEVMIIAISGGLTVSLAANSVLDLQSAYVPVTFTSNGGGDQVFLGSNAPTATGSTLTGIDESVTITNIDNFDTTVSILDNGDPTSPNVTLSNGTISGLTSSPIVVNGPGASVVVDGGSGNDNFTVNDFDYPTVINTGTGGNNVDVLATTNDLDINGNGPSTYVQVGSNPDTLTASTVANINGPVDFADAVGTMDVEDEGDSTARNVTIFDNLITGLAPATISQGLGGSIALYGGSGNNTYTFNNPGGPAYVSTGTGTDTVNVLATSSTLTIVGGGTHQRQRR